LPNKTLLPFKTVIIPTNRRVHEAKTQHLTRLIGEEEVSDNVDSDADNISTLNFQNYIQ
jgi:hypothetical protein